MSLTHVLDKNGQPLMPTQRCGKVVQVKLVLQLLIAIKMFTTFLKLLLEMIFLRR